MSFVPIFFFSRVGPASVVGTPLEREGGICKESEKKRVMEHVWICTLVHRRVHAARLIRSKDVPLSPSIPLERNSLLFLLGPFCNVIST